MYPTRVLLAQRFNSTGMMRPSFPLISCSDWFKSSSSCSWRFGSYFAKVMFPLWPAGFLQPYTCSRHMAEKLSSMAFNHKHSLADSFFIYRMSTAGVNFFIEWLCEPRHMYSNQAWLEILYITGFLKFPDSDRVLDIRDCSMDCFGG